MADDDGVAEENILYDLTIHAEWQQEPEQVSRGTKEKKTQVPLTGRLSSAAQRSAWTVLRSIGIQMSSGSPCSLHPGLVKLVNGQMYWQLAVSCDGRYAAILQDQYIEIRGARDDFSTNIGKCQLLKDKYPQWRKLAWSTEGYMLACSDSSGKVFVFDLTGGLICMIPADSNQMPNTPTDLSYALAGLSFKPYQGQEKWSAELFVVNFQGRLRKFLVSEEGEFKLQHTFMFTSQYARGVSAFLYEPVHSLLIVGGCGDQQSQEGGSMDAAAHGITAWRILSDYPHYKLVTDYEQDLRRSQGRQLVKRLKSFKLYGWSTNENEDGVFKLSLSPDGKSLAAVHFSGTYSLWEVPSLRLKKPWPLETQPSYDKVNPNVAENPKRRKQMKEHVRNFLITDLNWWSNKAVILARGTGALCVSSAKTLENLLGESPEWFEPAPLVTVANEGGFLGLECDCRFSSLKRRLVEEEETEPEAYEYEDSEDEADASLMHKGTKYMKHVLYYVTDSVRFQPPRKRPKIVTKTYRLVCLKSTTPEELYSRKIDNEEYGEALSLAKAYGLDCDLVYQRQWRKTPVSVASITDYLSKISKRSWVLHECLQRVPENIDAMRALLQYALRGTDLEALKAIGNGDGGRFILCDVEEEYEESIDEFDTEAIEEAQERKKQRRRDLAAEVDFGNLTLEQKELCRSRVKILHYLDRLSTYEEILGGLHAAEERYDPKFFEDFRSENIVEIATNYARACEWRALDTVFTYHTEQVIPHRLAVLSNFPETFPPKEYRNLLPEAGTREDDPEVLEWESSTWRDEDWCEFDQCRANLQTDYPDLGASLYEDNPEYKDFCVYPLTKKTLTDWYSFRAKEIERLSRQVDHSLELIRHGMERDVEGLDDLHVDMITMETLVYDCQVEDSHTFEKFQKMSDIEKVRLMMSKSTDAMYVKNVKRWLVPFLESCNKKNPNSFETLMREYLLTMAKKDLSNCLKVFQSSKADQPMPVIKDENLLMSLALECVYACESDKQLSNAFAILECLPEKGIGIVRMDLHNQVDDLECHLSAADILQSNELPKTIAYIRESQNDEEETQKLITKLTRIAGRKEPFLKEKEWTTLLMDVLDLQAKTYRCVSPKTCCEIYCQSLLCSSRHENIRLAGERMERSAAEALEPDYEYKEPDYLSTSGNSHQIPKVDYKTSKELVLSSAREYFDSSAMLTDPSMDLARACLSLISDTPKEIVEEADLIEALAILHGFGVSMLPIQVRMCKDKLELVQKAIDAKPSVTYKNSQRLLKLGRFLKVDSATDIEREGKILQLVAKAALKIKDYKISYDTCRRLMETSFAPIWRECKQLAEAEEFQDIKAKTDLLCFAVTYCAPEMIEPCLRAKCLLETQILYEKVHHQVSDRDSKSPGESPFSARGAIHQTKEILTSTSKTTKTVISHVSDKKWWKKTLRNLHPLRGTSMTDEWDDLNEKMEKQGYHPFYESLIENGYSNKSEGDYKNCRLPKLELCDFHMNESVLRTAKLEETLTEGDTIQPNSDVLLHLAEECIAQDNTLGLGYLLALPKAEEADACFDKNPRTALSLQLATYYYALQIYGHLQNESEASKKALYTCNPQSVIQVVLDYIESSKDTDWPEEVKDMVKRLKHYQELLIDYNQAQILQGLDKGVDVARFTQDNEYKHETILGLAMSLEDSVYAIAVSLAERYELSLWEVYMTHLEALFDSGMTIQEIEEKVKKLAFLAALVDKPDEFYARMKKDVYPTIEGTDHQRLMYFYSLLEHIDGDGPIPPVTHVKLIKKIKPAAPGLDYKKLTNGKHNPLEVIQPILKEGNVHVIAKMANKIPDAHGGSLHPSLIFCAWAIKMFWKFGKDDSERPQSTSEWIHHYESCSEYLQKLLPEDVIQFIDGIVFVQEGIESLKVDCRQEIVKRALKYSRQQGGKKKKMNDSESNMTWDAASQHFQQSLNHLEKLQNETIIALQQSEDKAIQKYALVFDMSRSEPEKLKKLLMEVVLDGQTPDLLDDLLQVITVDKWGAQTAVKEATRLITQMLSDSENTDPLLQGQDPLSKLEGIVSSVSEHKDAGGDLVSQDDIMAVLRPFCADTSVAVKPRLDVLQILEQSFKLTQDDLVLLVLYRTEAVISTGWSGKTLKEEQVATEEKRHQLFTALLQESEELEQFTALANLLKVWPPFQPKEGDASADVWCSLMKAFVETCGPGASKEVVDIMKYLQEKQFLDDNKIEYVFDLLCKNELPLSAVKAVLVNEQSSLFDSAVELLGKQEVCEDEELLQLLLKCHLVSRVVNTNYYAPLIDYVLANQDPNQELPYHMNVENIAFQLDEAGYKAEAGSLMLQYKGTHPALRTFDVAMGVLSKWLSK